MNTLKGKWLLAGLMAVSMTVANQSANAYGNGSAEAVVTGLAIGVVAASLIDNGGHHRHESYREVHHYYDEPRYRHCPPRVHVVHEEYYEDRRHHGHGYGHGRHDGHWNGRDGYYDRGRSVIVNHF